MGTSFPTLGRASNAMQGPKGSWLFSMVCSPGRTHALNPSSLRRYSRFALVLALAFAAGCRHPRKSTSAPNTADYADNIQSLVDKSQLSVLRWPNYSDYQQAVKTFYEDRNYELAWLRNLKPTPQTTAFIAAFQTADQKGLIPEDYDASRWAQRLKDIARVEQTHDTSDASQNTVAQFDAAMTICIMRYISDLRIGRVNPSHFNFDIDVKSKKYDLAEFVSDNVVDATDLPGLIRKVEPDSDQYRATEGALGRYLQMAKLQAAANAPALPDVPKGGVGVGGSYSATGDLMARLQLEGDAPGDYPYQPPQQAQNTGSAPPQQQQAPPKPRFGSKTIGKAKQLLHRKTGVTNGAAAGTAPRPVPPAFNPPRLPRVYTKALSDAVA